MSINKPLRVLLFTDSLVMLACAMIVPFYTLYVERIGGDILDAGAAASLFAVAAGVSSLVAGRFSDSLRRKERVVAIGYLVTAMGFLGYLWVDSVWQLLVVQVVVGLAQAGYAPAYDALYTKHIGSKRRLGSRWSIWESLQYFSIAGGAALGAVVIYYGGFPVLFITMATLCALSAMYLVTLPRRLL